jgi:hypothetical protein
MITKSGSSPDSECQVNKGIGYFKGDVDKFAEPLIVLPKEIIRDNSIIRVDATNTDKDSQTNATKQELPTTKTNATKQELPAAKLTTTETKVPAAKPTTKEKPTTKVPTKTNATKQELPAAKPTTKTNVTKQELPTTTKEKPTTKVPTKTNATKQELPTTTITTKKQQQPPIVENQTNIPTSIPT